MPDLVRLSDSDVKSRSASLPEWEFRGGALHRELQFDDFVAAFSFMTAVAFLAEAMAHHPEWSNVYNKVTIALSTHEVGGVSENDFAMAAKISEIYQRFARPTST
jgi:4a-hydroxytetrahydrobiopterin dehydratase